MNTWTGKKKDESKVSPLVSPILTPLVIFQKGIIISLNNAQVIRLYAELINDMLPSHLVSLDTSYRYIFLDIQNKRECCFYFLIIIGHINYVEKYYL